MANEIIKSDKVLKGIILDVVHDTIIMENGKEGKREVVEHCPAAAILPIDSDGNIIFVRQYRHPVKAYILEIPAGCCEENEDPLICAIRELEEETGYKTENMKLVTKYFVSAGYCTEEISLYIAKDLEKGVVNLDEDEFVTVEKYSLKESLEMIYDGRIIDSKTIIGLLAYADLEK